MANDVSPIYANGVRVATSTSEFTFDFWWTSPDTDEPKVMTRIILSPPIAKGFQNLLSQQLDIYEKRMGSILPKNAGKPQMGYLGHGRVPAESKEEEV